MESDKDIKTRIDTTIYKKLSEENVRKMVGFPQMKGYGYGNLMRCLVNESEIRVKGRRGSLAGMAGLDLILW